MFLMIGVTEDRKDLDFVQTIICNICGRYGSYQVCMTYTVLSLFFIPCFKWNKHYYVRTTCCNTLYELDPAVGKRIERGEKLEIQPENLCRMGNFEYSSGYKRCSRCGYETSEDFEYCPKCGNRF